VFAKEFGSQVSMGVKMDNVQVLVLFGGSLDDGPTDEVFTAEYKWYLIV
jgi:hypothetical protein